MENKIEKLKKEIKRRIEIIDGLNSSLIHHKSANCEAKQELEELEKKHFCNFNWVECTEDSKGRLYVTMSYPLYKVTYCPICGKKEIE